MRYGSVCSGIEAATMAWHALGWEPAFFSEIEAFPRAVLEHHYPEVPLHGDFTTIEENQYGKIDLLVGGTPCQSFSVAGLRGGLDDDRGNLALEFCRLAQRERPRWIVWENVPGVLSSNGGRDFGSILGALEDLGYGLAYRVLDAQYFGVAQRRRRVFVVGYLGDWRRAAAVLFERHSLSGHPAPRRETRQDPTHDVAQGTYECGRGVERPGDTRGQDPVVAVGVSLPEMRGGERADMVADLRMVRARADGGWDGPTVVGALTAKGPTGLGAPEVDAHHYVIAGHRTHSLRACRPAVTCGFYANEGTHGAGSNINKSPTLKASSAGSNLAAVCTASAVRRLTPVECERLQGFPDRFTAIPWRKKGPEDCPDGPRYKALGNSMAVPVMAYIGLRIQLIEDLMEVL